MDKVKEQHNEFQGYQHSVPPETTGMDNRYSGPKTEAGTHDCRYGEATPLIGRQRTTVTIYAASDGGYVVSRLMVKCDSCGQNGFELSYKYCPNCGLKFFKGDKDG